MLIDFALIQRAQAGDDQAFNGIVTAYRRRILGTVGRLIGRPEDVEDVAQEVFVRLYFSLGQLRTAEVFPNRGCTGWRRTHRTIICGKQRRRKESLMTDLSEQQVLLADAAAGGQESRDETRRSQARELARTLLAKVPEADRILLILKEVEGLSLKELREIYKIGENALKVRLFRARQRALKAYEQSGAGERGGPGKMAAGGVEG